MKRFRFFVPGDDGRPMDFPPIAPFWITGYSETHTVVVSYAPDMQTLTSESYWPDAEDIEDFGPSEIVFSGRFPEPEWWAAIHTINDSDGT